MRIRKARFGFPELKTLNKMGYRDVARRMSGSLSGRYKRGFNGFDEESFEEQEGENIRNNVIAF
jgi:hypothetical protein